MNNHIELHSKDSFSKMHDAGKLAAEVLDYITDYVKPNVSTGYLNDLCHEFILKNNAIPAPLNYKGFPKSTCISVNHVVCHGIPGEKILDNGDILNIDITVILCLKYHRYIKFFLLVFHDKLHGLPKYKWT